MPVKKGNADVTPPRSLPLYEVLKRQIAENVMSGRWPAGMVLPSEMALAQEFRVAPGTMRRALSELTASGMLTRRRKTGTVVTGRAPDQNLDLYFRYFRLHRADGSLVSSTARNLDLFHGAPTASEKEQLKLEDGQEVVRLRRLRLVDGAAIMIETMTMPGARIPDFPKETPDVPPLIFQHLVDAYAIRITAVREELSAVMASEADRRDLGLDAPAALLRIVQTAFDQLGAPVVFAVQHGLTDDYRYVNEVHQ
ncbi:GntR family transcriptional regulator [Acuticoccus kandeliae]|uniref:GntR family transcriptional regulator n=1 Tax=Acuticoccus kandeliae TaxID=2073160 RepID=UPI000D3E7929|nr:GntR family transcriptional regulator [Acuticoccus kandeliae]